jgi:hypothetical protein
VMKTLRKNPAERFQSVAELAQALAPFGPPGAFIGAAPISISAPQLGPSATLSDSSQDTPVKAAASRVATLVAPLAIAVVMLLAGVGLRAWWISAAARATAASPVSVPAAPAAPTSATATTPPALPHAVTATFDASPHATPVVASATPSASAKASAAAPARRAAPQKAPVKAGSKRDLGF